MSNDSIRRLPLVDLAAQRTALGSEIDAAIGRVLDHGRFIMGPEVQELEAELAGYTGATSVVSCSSGTDAILMSLMAWGIGPGDAVFLPAFTFTATPEAVALLGATPVFVDVSPDDFNIDIRSLKRTIDSIDPLDPKVVIGVDLFGAPADYEGIKELASERGMKVLADAAQSFGASTAAGKVGILADATATSFFPSKPLACYGDGGAVFTVDPSMAEDLRSIRLHGRGSSKYDIVRLGINGRLDTLQAAVLLKKLSVYEDERRQRELLAKRYNEALSGSVRVPQVPDGVASAWAYYTIRHSKRDAIASFLSDQRIASEVYYPKPLHLQPVYRSCPMDPKGLPIAEALSTEVLSLPMHAYLSELDQNRVIQAVLDALSSIDA